ncbi:phage tail tip lysozyme [Salipiger thiooxidans]|uniref:phage tail tip lysozyme n=1 Tax=Salipiger thiooxidans TaxID=282683 RepID=UPI001CFB866D|nr:phage tail tip lysozyme [Salipiger thiooxidans]
MAFRVAGYLSMRGGKEAAADVRALKTATDELNAATTGATTSTGAEEAALSGAGAEARRTTTILDRLGATYDSVKTRAGAAFDRLRGGARGAGDSAQIAAGQVGNLSAQFFDIGVMMQAGQNPLQLALQQGSQIAQVIGPMGAAKAVRALGTAFMSLMSPVNLITIGAIAAGAALMSWLTRSKDEAETLEDVLDRINSRLDEFGDLASRGTDDLIERFGSAGREIQTLQRDLQSLALEELLLDAAKAGDELTNSMSAKGIQDLFDERDRRTSRTGRGANYGSYGAMIGDIGNADTVDNQIAAITDLLETLKDATGGIQGMTAEQQEFYRESLRVLEILQRIKAATEAIPQDIRDQADAAAKAYIERRKITTELQREIDLSDAILRFGERSAEVEALRMEQAQEVLGARLKEKGFLPQIIEQVLELNRAEMERAKAIRDAEAARDWRGQISQLQAQAEITRAIVAHGRDSLEVKKLQIAAERDQMELMLAQQSWSEEQKAGYRAAWEAQNGLSSADPFGSLAASGDYLRQADLRLEKLRLEQQLLGQSEAVRTRILALYEAELLIRQQGLDASSDRAREVRDAVLEEAELTREIARQAQAWETVRSAGTQAIDDIFDRLINRDLAGALETIAEEFATTFSNLGMLNPLKNAVFGTDLPTMDDLGGWQGIWGRLTGGDMADPDFSQMKAYSTASMTVTAGSVTVTGALAAEPFSASGLGGGAGLSGSPAVQEQIWRFFSEKGLAPHQIAAILGNVSAESAFNPMAVGDGGTSFGLFQHHAGRGQGLLGALGGMGGLGNVEAQLQYAWSELLTGENGVLQKLLASTNVREATEAFVGFERPQGWSAANPSGAHGWADRLGGAEEALAKFGTTATTAQQTLGTLGQGFDVLGGLLSSLTGAGGSGATSWVGGLVDAILGPAAAAAPANADGGYQYFPGGSRADSGLIRISSGEFVVNGAATSRNRGLLEWINSGGDAMASLPARANGGGFAGMPVSAGPREIQVVTPPGMPMALSVEDEALPGGGRREKYVLSEMVGNALTMPGGKARKAMQGQYGQRLVGPRR